LKVPEHLTVARWPEHARYGKVAGQPNQHFLEPRFFTEAFLRPIQPHQAQVAVLMFEFGTFSHKVMHGFSEFLPRLADFLGSLPAGWRYAVEIRNEDYLVSEYFSLLARHNVAHVFNAWTRMPTLSDQIQLEGAFTADFTVVRGLLRRGRTYEQAVQRFEPYKSIQDPDPLTRAALRKIAERALIKRSRAYLFINNRLEGNAPETIDAVVSQMG
jgi:uncharacterized protein YecE (DUF72 family)